MLVRNLSLISSVGGIFVFRCRKYLVLHELHLNLSFIHLLLSDLEQCRQECLNNVGTFFQESYPWGMDIISADIISTDMISADIISSRSDIISADIISVLAVLICINKETTYRSLPRNACVIDRSLDTGDGRPHEADVMPD